MTNEFTLMKEARLSMRMTKMQERTAEDKRMTLAAIERQRRDQAWQRELRRRADRLRYDEWPLG